MIELKNIDVVFGKKPERALPLLDQGQAREEIRSELDLVVGVQNANLTIKKGEICVLMGLSGSGKSSLLRCIIGLNSVTRGEVNIEHNNSIIDYTKADAATQREIRMKRISMVFQKFALMPWLTVAQNVSMPLELQGLPKKEIDAKVAVQLELVGLAQWADLKPSELSGGMQQRVGLARALVTESDILLMDEPFSALDPLIRNQLQDELLQLQKTLQKTIVFVSHDLDEALKLGTNIAIMKDGKIVQYGKPQDIVLNPANDYVKDFVAHTNPINVLQANDIMHAIDDIDLTEKGYCLNKRYDYWLSENQTCVQFQGKPFEVQKWSEDQSIDTLDKAPTCINKNTSMRDAMEIRYYTGHSVFIREDKKISGVIGDKQLYYALLGKMMSDD
jgi:glycine betaine/proline transport system ATP-binding protein